MILVLGSSRTDLFHLTALQHKGAPLHEVNNVSDGAKDIETVSGIQNCTIKNCMRTREVISGETEMTTRNGALLDRLTHRVHIIEANGETYRLKHAKKKTRQEKRRD